MRGTKRRKGERAKKKTPEPKRDNFQKYRGTMHTNCRRNHATGIKNTKRIKKVETFFDETAALRSAPYTQREFNSFYFLYRF